ncbi:MAG: DUF4268 domain-containing protein [Ruminococcus sp.]|nr:DUF4268 domain-containing protein [Ruminococcus sp.]
MKGSESKMIAFMEGADKRFIIPVYQRKYDWKLDNCRQLYDDLKKIVTDGRDSHFFGSIVSAVVPNGSKIEYHIIDGQQRLTTISLLLLAIRDLARSSKIEIEEKNLHEQIEERFLISKWAKDEDRIKLRPVKSDRDALVKLFGDEEDYEANSNLTLNYRYFYDIVQKEEVKAEELFAAIAKLEIISITLDPGDNAQLIFESLNSTGLALTEGDKIRNYILMSLQPPEQNKYYENYWVKIEKCTQNDVSGFIRDYLSIKQQVTPTINNVYKAFKEYAQSKNFPIENLMEDLLKYARLFEKLLTGKSGLGSKKLDDCLYRLNRLEIVVTRPFLMEVLRLNQDSKLSLNEVEQVFFVTESYLFRRNICEVPTNALNKIFLTLNKDILRYDNSTKDYVDKFIYTLLGKRESGRFPNDEEFVKQLSEKQVYQMRGKYKAYLFERFENYGTIETKDVYTHLDNNVYTIEHIMPQRLTPAWIEDLGENNAKEIHALWLHRLANLTLTGYNPNLSNKPFKEKRDDKTSGYKESGLKMNQKIAMKDVWGLKELEERNVEMINKAIEIWYYPSTDFKPAEKEFEAYSLDDETIDFTGRDIIKYSYQAVEHIVSSWAEMFENMVKFLHQKDKSVLTEFAYKNKGESDLSVYFRNNTSELRQALQVDDNIYVEKNTNTLLKISILRKLFTHYNIDAMDLVFYLKDETNKRVETDRHEIRRKYWEYALPIITEKNYLRGTFSGCKPTTSNTTSGFFGLSGFCISCVANYDNARIDFWLGNNDTEKNKAAFDLLYNNREEIESSLGVSLTWDRANENKASWICYHLNNVSITNEADWPKMAEFHAEWSDKICGKMLEYLLDEESKKLLYISGLVKEWVKMSDYAVLDLERCNRTYTRFTTPLMSNLLPDIPNAPSGWNTDNHYFYEIMNRSGDSVYIQFALSSHNITPEFRALCDKINVHYPAKMGKVDWQWRIPFKTSTIKLDVNTSKVEIFEKLNYCLEEIKEFEKDLKEKLN